MKVKAKASGSKVRVRIQGSAFRVHGSPAQGWDYRVRVGVGR